MKFTVILSALSVASSVYAATLKNGKVKMGVAANTIKFNNSAYVNAMSNFDYMVAENGCKMASIQPQQGKYNFNDCDAHLNKAKQMGMDFRGHCLIWHSMPPQWFERTTGEALKRAIVDHITTTLKHYEGKIGAWDVVNEAIDDSSNGPQWKMRQSFLYKNVPDFVDLAFKTARQVSPSTKLFYNDYNTEGVWGKTDAVFNFVKDLKSRGIPIDGVGLQYHVSTQYYPKFDRINKLIADYCALGLELHITELDVKGGNDENTQAKVYSEALKACLNNSCCKAFLVWGVGDNDSWLGANEKGLLFDANYRPKKAYDALVQTLGGTSGGSQQQQNNNNNQWNQQQQQQQQQQQNTNNNQWNQQQQNNNNNQWNQQQQAAPQQNASAGGNCSGIWGQCGGIGFNGPKCCSQGTCKKINDYYSQCQN